MKVDCRAKALRRLGLRALSGAEALPIATQIELFEDVSLILSGDEREQARFIAFSFREAVQHQTDFLAQLYQGTGTTEGA